MSGLRRCCRFALRFLAFSLVFVNDVAASIRSLRRPRSAGTPHVHPPSDAVNALAKEPPSDAARVWANVSGTNFSGASAPAAVAVAIGKLVDAEAAGTNVSESVAVGADVDKFDSQTVADKAAQVKQVLNDWAQCTLVERDTAAPSAAFMSDQPPFIDPVGEDYAPTKMPITKADRSKLKQRMWMLDTIVTLLRKHRVDYWLECGTLLGSYRHRGFIPWDDDIDLSTPISQQKRLLGAVKTEAAARGIVINQLFFPPGNHVYQPAVAYIQRHAPRVANTQAFDATLGTQGYFVQAYYKGLKLDLWQTFPVELDNKVFYSNGASGPVLFSRHDVYPLKPCVFEGQVYNCPARSHRYLVGIYNEIALDPAWASWWSQPYCTWNIVSVYSKKEVRTYGMTDPNFAMMTYDPAAAGEVRMNVPKHLESQADTPETYRTASVLGSPDAEIMAQPSGWGLASSQLMPR